MMIAFSRLYIILRIKYWKIKNWYFWWAPDSEVDQQQIYLAFCKWKQLVTWSALFYVTIDLLANQKNINLKETVSDILKGSKILI